MIALSLPSFTLGCCHERYLPIASPDNSVGIQYHTVEWLKDLAWRARTFNSVIFVLHALPNDENRTELSASAYWF